MCDARIVRQFSAITETDIKRAMQNLGTPNLNESLAVDARQELDLRIGCAFTRFQTRFFQGMYGDLDASLVSYGPCQTPTLGLCVDRHDKIQTFSPEKYWVLDVRLDVKGRVVRLDWDRCRIFDRLAGQMFLNSVLASKRMVVESVKKKEKSKPRPLALNTVELMRVASSGLNMSPHYAMQLAERLYTQVSFPCVCTTTSTCAMALFARRPLVPWPCLHDGVRLCHDLVCTGRRRDRPSLQPSLAHSSTHPLARFDRPR